METKVIEAVSETLKKFGVEKFAISCLRANGDILSCAMGMTPIEAIGSLEVTKNFVLQGMKATQLQQIQTQKEASFVHQETKTKQ